MPDTCHFDFAFQGTPTELITKAQQAIEDAGGQLQGDESAGRYMVPTPFGLIEGSYTIAAQVFTVDITKKPLLIGCEAIRKTIENLLELLTSTGSVPSFPYELPTAPQGAPWEQRSFDPEQKLRPWIEAVGQGELEQIASDILAQVPQEKRGGTDEQTLRHLVRKELSYAVGNQLQQEVRAASDKRVAQIFGRESPTQREPAVEVQARLEKAKAGIAQISTATDVDEILASSAMLMRKKFDALTAAGFSEEQAMQILLAEIAKPKR
jgi:acetolactate synthase small subunit